MFIIHSLEDFEEVIDLLEKMKRSQLHRTQKDEAHTKAYIAALDDVREAIRDWRAQTREGTRRA
jgi:hypothetical protein